jgi:hypothetical protein
MLYSMGYILSRDDGTRDRDLSGLDQEPA